MRSFSKDWDAGSRPLKQISMRYPMEIAGGDTNSQQSVSPLLFRESTTPINRHAGIELRNKDLDGETMEFNNEDWKRIEGALVETMDKRGLQKRCFLKVIFRSNMGIYEKERMWAKALQRMGYEVDKVENLWSAASITGLLVIHLKGGCVIMALWVIDEKTEVLSIGEIEGEDEIADLLASLSSSNIVSGVMRVFTYESIPEQNL